MASTTGWSFFVKKARAISRRWSSRNFMAKPTLINSWTAALHYRILSANTVSKKLCSILFITLPNSLRKCSLVDWSKRKFLHKVLMAIVHCLQMRDTISSDPKAMEINIRGPSTPEFCRIKVIGLRLVKPSEESSNLTHWIRNYGKTAANLKSGRRRHLNKNQT